MICKLIQSIRALGVLSCFRLYINLCKLSLFLYFHECWLFIEPLIIHRTITSILAFLVPLILSQLHTAQSSLDFKFLLSIPCISFNSSPLMVSSPQFRLSNCLFASIVPASSCPLWLVESYLYLADNPISNCHKSDFWLDMTVWT